MATVKAAGGATWEMGPPAMDVSGVPRKFLDVPYSVKSDRHKLDIYLPDEGVGPFPAVVFFHGGAFVGGDKRDMQIAVIIDCLNRGFAAVSVEYRLSPEAVFPQAVNDCRAAIKFLKATAPTYMLDPRRFAVSGTSAGAYLALFCAATGDVPFFDDAELDFDFVAEAGVTASAAAAIGFFGLYALPEASLYSKALPNESGQPGGWDFTADFFGAPPEKYPFLAEFADVSKWVTDKMPQTLLQAGTADVVVPYSDSVMLASAIAEKAGADRVRLDTLEGAEHGDQRYYESAENQERIFAFLKKYL
ncbi:MAG: alpha/beta hydrolase [Oscillospiraceae bacterium]|jgi:acetyl esterase/lipase|nr:alpha/beta hydrolase [Oscillospiraceae bacterium]